MDWLLESFGMNADSDLAEGFIRAALHEGAVYPAYTRGWSYINKWFGDMQVCVHVRNPRDGEPGEVVGADLHARGSRACRLKVISTLAVTNPDDPLERRILATNVDGEDGTLVFNVVNADLLPCWKDGTVIDLQIIAKAFALHVYADEDEFTRETSQPFQRDDLNNGEESWITAEVGSVLPFGFLNMHMVRDGEDSRELTDDDLFEESRTLITGRIAHTRARDLVLGAHRAKLFYVEVETDNFGLVELYADFAALPGEECRKLRPGAIVQAEVLLSADAMLDERQTEPPLSALNNYALVAEAFEYPYSFDRLWNALAEHCVYLSDGSRRVIHGREAILAFLQERSGLLTDPENRYHSCFAILTKAEDGLPHRTGDRCVVLRQGEQEEPVAIVFLTMDEENRIVEICLTEEPGYRFTVVPYDRWSLWAQWSGRGDGEGCDDERIE